jgi:hypothetical protein
MSFVMDKEQVYIKQKIMQVLALKEFGVRTSA